MDAPGRILIVFVGFGISGYFRRRANQSGQADEIDFSEERTWLRRLRVGGALLGYGTMLTFLVYPPLVAWAQLDLSASLRWAGAGLMLLMIPPIYWLFVSLGKIVTPTVSIRDQHELVMEGPYRYIRHPLYTFGFLNFVGMSLLAANWFMLVSLLVGMFALVARTDKEEEKLVERFGDQYREYMSRTGRFLPRFRTQPGA